MNTLTIKDIAREAGVSVSSVSRVINNNYPVSPEVRKRVEAAMLANDYHPNAVARSLRSSKTHMIALIVPDLPNLFFMRVAKGIEKEIAKNGYCLTIASSGGKAAKERALIEVFFARRIDGLIIASTDASSEKIDECTNNGVPVVAIDRDIPGIGRNKVLWNNVDGVRELTQHLIENGHRRIGVINVSLSNENGKARLEGFKQVMKESGLPLPSKYVSGPNHTVEEAEASVMKMMKLPNRPTALFCANDVVLNGTLRALRKLNLRVYDDVSVAAYGCCDCNEFVLPQITTAEQDCVELGQKAGWLLNRIIEKKTSPSSGILLSTVLVKRDSVRKIAQD